MAKKKKPIEMFEEGKQILKEIENKKKSESEGIMPTMDLGSKRVKCIIRKAGKAFEFVEIEAECSLDEVLMLKGWADDGLTEPSTTQVPQAEVKVVSAPQPKFTEMEEIVYDPTNTFNGECKYCQSDMWDNTKPNPEYPQAKPKYKCKNKDCGYIYFPENQNWYKPDPNFKK